MLNSLVRNRVQIFTLPFSLKEGTFLCSLKLESTVGYVVYHASFTKSILVLNSVAKKSTYFDLK